MEKQTGFFDIDEVDSSADTTSRIGFLSINTDFHTDLIP
jgi:hypothetical protein